MLQQVINLPRWTLLKPRQRVTDLRPVHVPTLGIRIAVLLSTVHSVRCGAVPRAVAGLIINFFQPAILMASVWFAVIGAYLSAHRPDTNLAFKSVLGRVAEGHILTVGVPNIILGIAGVLLIVALLCRRRC